MTPPVPSDAAMADRLVELGRALYDRGLTHGNTGNLSARLSDDRILVTPTNSCLGRLDPRRMALVDRDGRHLGGDPPSKETVLHLAMYAARPEAAGIAHLHSPWAVAAACLDGVDPDDVLPALTPYYVMRVGRLALVPYAPPGDPGLADAVAPLAAEHHALLLANHGPLVAGRTIDAAVDAIEELEATARLALTLTGRPSRPLTPAQVAELRLRHPS